MPSASVVVLYLVLKLTARINESNVASVAFGFGRQIGVNQVYQQWKVGQVSSHFCGVDGYRFSVSPLRIPPSSKNWNNNPGCKNGYHQKSKKN
jgi:hypothetical protein